MTAFPSISTVGVEPLKILVLIHEYPPTGGGGGRVAMDLCHGLAARGHKIQLLTAHWGDLPLEEEPQKGLRIVRLHSGRRQAYKAGLSAMMGYVVASVWRGLKIIRQWKPDLIHVHFAVPGGAAAWLLSQLSGLPYVLTAHLGDVPGGVPEKTGRWFQWIFPFTPPIWRRAGRVVAVSEFTRSLALKKYAVNIQVIPNGVDLKELDPGDISPNHTPRILFTGRFVSQKNPLLFVRTLAELKDLDWDCAMLGDGALRPEVENELKRCGLEDRVKLTGWLTPEEVLSWYRQSDILFMPSRSEGLPVVGVQGLALGLALVLSNAGGNPELIQEGVNGSLVNVDDVGGYCVALKKLLSDPERLLAARRASREMARKFDLERIVPAYERVFLDLWIEGKHAAKN